MAEPTKTDWPSLVTAIALVVIAALAGWSEVQRKALLPGGTPAPSLEGVHLDGRQAQLEALRGKAVLLSFWATWCGPCKAELPELLEVAREHEKDGLVFLAVNQDDPDGQAEAVRDFVRRMPGLERSAVLGSPSDGARYLIQLFPTMYVLDRQGRVSTSFAGTPATWQVRRWAQAALATPSP